MKIYAPRFEACLTPGCGKFNALDQACYGCGWECKVYPDGEMLNYTPHAVVIMMDDKTLVLPSSGIARVDVTRSLVDGLTISRFGNRVIPIYKWTPGKLAGSPKRGQTSCLSSAESWQRRCLIETI